MAAGVPLVTTRVGQAAELVVDGENGLLADVDDVDALGCRGRRVSMTTRRWLRGFAPAGRPTAEANAEERLDSRWAALLDGFVRKAVARLTARASGRYARAALALGASARADAACDGSARLLRPRPRAASRASRSPEGRRSSSGSPRRFPNDPTDFNLLYLGSTWLPRDLDALLRLARRRGVPVVVNQDGVAYPGWAGERDG